MNTRTSNYNSYINYYSGPIGHRDFISVLEDLYPSKSNEEQQKETKSEGDDLIIKTIPRFSL